MGQQLSAAISAAEQDSNKIIEEQLDERLAKLGVAANADVLTYVGPINEIAGDHVKDAIEALVPKKN